MFIKTKVDDSYYSIGAVRADEVSAVLIEENGSGHHIGFHLKGHNTFYLHDIKPTYDEAMAVRDALIAEIGTPVIIIS